MINKFQQGGKNQVMQFVEGLAQTLQTDPNNIIQIAKKYPEVLKQAIQAYQETQDMTKAAEAFQQATQTLQQQTQTMKHGAKLQYIKSLKHQCADDEELVYYKKGGSVDCGCMKKGGEIKNSNSKKNSTIDEFKKRQEEAKKKREAEKNVPNYPPQGSNKTNRFWAEKINKDKQHKNDYKDTKDETTPPNINKGIGRNKKGGEVKKSCGGSSIVAKFKAKCGTKMKKHQQGGSLNRNPFHLEFLKSVKN